MKRLGWLTSTLVLASCRGDIAPPADGADPCSMCAVLAAEFEDDLRKEQACDPSAPDQCLKVASFFCGCPVCARRPQGFVFSDGNDFAGTHSRRSGWHITSTSGLRPEPWKPLAGSGSATQELG
jgi:hypothetical protein